MTLMCIDRSQSPTHKSNFLQGRKSPVNNNNNNNNNSHNNHNNNHSNNINQQNNANSNNNNHRRNSCSPPLSKQQQQQQDNNKSQQQQNNPESSRKLERSTSEPVQDSNRRASVQTSTTNSSRYKTELCRPFEENGTCKYGDKCQFAHGSKELRTMARHPKYKTELCRTFHTTGLCPYGPRCHFIHNSEQSKKRILTTLASTAVSSTSPPPVAPAPRQNLGSAGDISPPSSNETSPTGSKTFDDMFMQQPLSAASTLLSMLNINPNSDCFQEAYNYMGDRVFVDALDNYSLAGGLIPDYYVNQAFEEGGFIRRPVYDGPFQVQN